MLGRIDSYRSADGALSAWTSTLLVGNNTLRAMWYYSDPKVRCNIYFDSIRASLRRAEKMNLEMVDLGPSTAATKEMKDKLGFSANEDWRESIKGIEEDVKEAAVIPEYFHLNLP